MTPDLGDPDVGGSGPERWPGRRPDGGAGSRPGPDSGADHSGQERAVPAEPDHSPSSNAVERRQSRWATVLAVLQRVLYLAVTVAVGSCCRGFRAVPSRRGCSCRSG